jgi:hypothetical protein
MPIQDTLVKWSKDTLKVRSYTGFDEFANPTWVSTTAESSYSCLVNNTAKAIRGKSGVLVTSPTQVYIAGNPSIHIEDKITLPDGNQPEIQSIQYNGGFDGNPVFMVVFV